MEQTGNSPDEIGFSQVPELARERLDNPELLSESLDALVQRLATPEALNSSLQRVMGRQAELYQKSTQLRDNGQSLSKADQIELDQINETLLNLQRLSESYPSDQ